VFSEYWPASTEPAIHHLIMELVFATTNEHKAEEVRALLSGTKITLRTLKEFPHIPEPPETGNSFEANALQKARFVWEHLKKPCIADDSGLEVDALDGAPGIHSKRYSEEATAAANNALLLQRMGNALQRSARFRCVLAYVNADVERTVDGSCTGTIGLVEVGSEGFGYDPLFFPEGHKGRSMAQLSMEEKNTISHRGRAFSQLPALLAGLRSP
jgi:XTP/dITP diphosphohydrolase